MTDQRADPVDGSVDDALVEGGGGLEACAAGTAHEVAHLPVDGPGICQQRLFEDPVVDAAALVGGDGDGDSDEAAGDGNGASALLQHDPGTGNVRLTSAETNGELNTRLVIEARPNGQGGPAPATLDVHADPPFAGGADLGPLFVSEPAERFVRFSLPLSAPWLPILGNTDLMITVSSTDGAVVRTVRVRLEVEVHHETDIKPIWRERCTGCHEEPDPEKGLVLVDPVPGRAFRNIVNVFASEPKISSIASLFIRPFFPERSYLYHKIRGTHLEPDVGGDGERMPPGDESILEIGLQRLIESWILQGAPE